MKHRDLVVLDLPGGTRLLIACDSSGGIGPKEQDAVSVPAYVVGRFIARVPLMEVVAAGGRPLVLVDNCCVEPSPTGEEILRGVRDEARLVGLGDDAITGSFEKNIPVVQTGLGVTVVAVAKRPLGAAADGDMVIALGLPKVGHEVRLDDPDILDLPTLIAVSQNPHIHDVLPVGSRGIAAELETMAESADLRAEIFPPEPGWDLAKSAGPATCCLLAVPPNVFPALAVTLTRPWAVVGKLSAGPEI